MQIAGTSSSCHRPLTFRGRKGPQDTWETEKNGMGSRLVIPGRTHTNTQHDIVMLVSVGEQKLMLVGLFPASGIPARR